MVSQTNAHDAQTLMSKNSVVGEKVAAPIWTAMAYLLGHAQGRGLEFLYIWLTMICVS